MTEQTFNNLLKNSNALFDRNNDIWPKETILTKLQKTRCLRSGNVSYIR